MSNKQNVFFGGATALVTPFYNGEIDYSALEKMIEFQISNGADGIVLLGTTGEAPTVYENERRELIDFAVKKINKRVPLIIGTGSNATSVAVRYSKSAQEQGADACLVVSPYYNKATPEGIIQHYKEIAKEVQIPIIIYNVPARTGLKIPMEVYNALAKTDNIVGVKEASGDLGYLTELLYRHKDSFDVYTGCDDHILPTLALGGMGVISVVGNLVPQRISQLCHEFQKGNTREARELQLSLTPLITELFREVNPIPVKCAMSQMGMCQEEYRLPLCKSTRQKEILQILKEYKLL